MSKLNNSSHPLTDPVLLDLSDPELLTLIRGGKVDVHELNIRIGVGGSGAREVWDLKRSLKMIRRHQEMPKKDQSE